MALIRTTMDCRNQMPISVVEAANFFTKSYNFIILYHPIKTGIETFQRKIKSW